MTPEDASAVFALVERLWPDAPPWDSLVQDHVYATLRRFALTGQQAEAAVVALRAEHRFKTLAPAELLEPLRAAANAALAAIPDDEPHLERTAETLRRCPDELEPLAREWLATQTPHMRRNWTGQDLTLPAAPGKWHYGRQFIRWALAEHADAIERAVAAKPTINTAAADAVRYIADGCGVGYSDRCRQAARAEVARAKDAGEQPRPSNVMASILRLTH